MIIITTTIIAVLASTLAFVMWKKTTVQIWQCNFCSQWFDRDGSRWVFRPANTEFISSSVCPHCAQPDKEPAFTLLPGYWDHGSKQTLAEYFSTAKSAGEEQGTKN